MTNRQFEPGRGTKSLIGMIVLSASILTSTFLMGMKIQKLIDGLTTVTVQHDALLSMKPCRQDRIEN